MGRPVLKQKGRPHPIRWFTVFSGLVFFGACLVGILGWAYVGTPRVVAITPLAEAQRVSRETGIAVRFSKPVHRRALTPSIQPNLAGEWVYESPLVKEHFFRSIRFLPTHPFDPDTTYTVTLDGVVDAFAIGTPKSIQWTFTTLPLPDVLRVTPADKAGGVSPDEGVDLVLSGPADESVQFSAFLEPEIPVMQTYSEDRTVLHLQPSQLLQQGTIHTVRVERVFVLREYLGGAILRQSEPETVSTTTFHVRPPPNLKAVEPGGEHVTVGSPIRITFSEPMDRSSVETGVIFEPQTDGVWSWDETQTVAQFLPTAELQYDTRYTVRIPENVRTANGGFFEEAATFQFRTIGPVRVSATVPQNDETGIAVSSTVRVRFDQAVVHESAEALFHISPAVHGAFSWEENVLIFQPAEPFSHQTPYSATLESGVESVDGLPSTDAVTFRFTTVSETVLLDIAVDLQDKPLSCEAAALKMALAHYGIRTSEDAIMQKVGFDPTPHSKGTWGDPYEAFVGDINGKQNTTGYGVYWGPIAQAANDWRATEARTAMTVIELAQEIAAGHPVIIWGVYGNGYRDDWKTPSGKSILAWKGEHARTVVGFVGTENDPRTFILNDPNAGRIYWSREQLERNWSAFENAAVIVR